jgi:uncharacterized membrane protein YfbV (UPF0208 family)
MDELLNLTLYGFPAVAVVVGITQVIKMIWDNSRWMPFIAVVVGISLMEIASPASLGFNIVKGIVVGLAASGLWDFGKKTVLNK